MHSNKGSLYISDEWKSFLTEHGLDSSISRRRNSCHDNEVEESFFQPLKHEQIKKELLEKTGYKG